jgi:hypothetical protein
LHGACKEVVAPLSLWKLRFGQGDRHLDCSCREGDVERGSLALVEGKGSAQLGSDPTLAVTPLHETADGSHKRAVLGYQLSGPQGSAALEVTGHGRAWPLPGLAPETERTLACLYAALLLYRPEP